MRARAPSLATKAASALICRLTAAGSIVHVPRDAIGVETAGWCVGMQSVVGLNRTTWTQLERSKVSTKLHSRAAYLSNVGDCVGRGVVWGETSRVGVGDVVIAAVVISKVMLVAMIGLLRNLDPVSAIIGVLIFIVSIRQVFFDTLV